MNIKNKLFATLIMSLLAFGGGGYFLYYQFYSASQNSERWIEVQYQQPHIIAPVKLDSRATFKARITSNPDNEILSGLNATALPSGSGTFDSHSSVSSGSYNYAYKSTNRKSIFTETSQGGTSGLLAYSSSSSGSKSAGDNTTSSVSGFSSSLSTSTGPMAVPYNNNNTPQALVDPGGDPDQRTRIPVGEGWWFVLMLAVIYGFYRKFR